MWESIVIRESGTRGKKATRRGQAQKISVFGTAHVHQWLGQRGLEGERDWDVGGAPWNGPALSIPVAAARYLVKEGVARGDAIGVFER